MYDCFAFMSICAPYVPSASEGKKKTPDPLELEL